MLGDANQSVLMKRAAFAQNTFHVTGAKRGPRMFRGTLAVEPALHEAGANPLADFPPRHPLAHSDYFPCAVRDRHGGQPGVWVVKPPGKEEVAKVQRRGAKFNDDLV